MRVIDKKYADAVLALADKVFKKSDNEFARAVALFFVDIVSDMDEWQERESVPSHEMSRPQLDDTIRSSSYYYNHIFARYYLDVFKTRKYSANYALKKAQKAVQHFVNLGDFSTPLNILGTVALRLVSRGYFSEAYRLLEKANEIAGEKRRLILGRIFGEIAIELFKKGQIDKGIIFIEKSRRILESLRYFLDLIWMYSHAINILADLEAYDTIEKLLRNIANIRIELILIIRALKAIGDPHYYSKFLNLFSEKLNKASNEDYQALIDEIVSNIAAFTKNATGLFFIDSLRREVEVRGFRELSLVAEFENLLSKINSSLDKAKLIHEGIRLSDELDKLGKSRIAGRYLHRLIEKLISSDLDPGKIATLSEIAALYYENSGDYERVYELFGFVAQKFVEFGMIDEAFIMIENAGEYATVSKLIKMRLLYEPTLRTLAKKYPDKLRFLIDKVFQLQKSGLDFAASYLLASIVEELIKVQKYKEALKFIYPLFNSPRPSVYFSEIIHLLIDNDLLRDVFRILEKLEPTDPDRERIIIEAVLKMISRGHIDEGIELLEKYSDSISKDKLAKTLSDLSILLAEKNHISYAFKYAPIALRMLIDRNAYLTALNTIAKITAYCREMDVLIEFANIILRQIIDLFHISEVK